MNGYTPRRSFLGMLAGAAAWLSAQWNGAFGQDTRKPPGKNQGKRREGGYVLPHELEAFQKLSVVLGRVTSQSITVSLLSQEAGEAYLEYGTASGKYTKKTKVCSLPKGQAVEFTLDKLQSNTAYFYQVQMRTSAAGAFQARPECRFHTQRSPGSTFTFCVQGDSHPERPQMSEPNLYARTLQKAANEHPDFYFCMGDDFSVNKVNIVTPENLAQPYLLQRPFLGLVAQTSSLILLNGNHEQASLFNYQQKDVRREVAIGVQNARNRLYPMPAPDGFYTGNQEELKSIGSLKDYFAWTWGDALFIVLDNYWHSPSLVDTGYKGGEGKDRDEKRTRDWWNISMGDAQYHWFKKTLEQSKAKYKFVFAHHVLGTGRGGVEMADQYEWGGQGKRSGEFKQHRPGWELPVHQLMVKHGVTIFFQGHDHLYVRQEKDGVIYQEVPMPCDHTYTAHNAERYQSGVKHPNSGYLRVTVSPEQVKVEYVRCYLPKDETAQKKTGQIAHSYLVKNGKRA